MAKNLIRRVTEGIGLIGSLGIMALAGCKLDVPGPDPNPPTTKPQVSLTVDPLSGTTQTSRTIKVNGTDAGGDIMNYEAFADYNNNRKEDSGELIISQSTPIDGSYTLNRGNFKVFGQVTDSEGNTDKKSLDVIVSDPPQPGYVNISGVVLEDDETHTRRTGVMKAYDTRTPNGDGTFTYGTPIYDLNHPTQDEFSISSSGSSSFTLNKLTDSSDTIYLRAVSGNPSSSNPKDYSYTRTIDLSAIDNDLSSGSDVRMNPVRVTPHVDIDGQNGIGNFDSPTKGNISEVDGFVYHLKEIFSLGYHLSKNGINYVDILTYNTADPNAGTNGNSFNLAELALTNSIITKISNVITGGSLANPGNLRAGLNIIQQSYYDNKVPINPPFSLVNGSPHNFYGGYLIMPNRSLGS